MEREIMIENNQKEEKGATMVEYALLVALIAIALIGALNLLTEDISEAFSTVGSHLDESM